MSSAQGIPGVNVSTDTCGSAVSPNPPLAPFCLLSDQLSEERTKALVNWKHRTTEPLTCLISINDVLTL